jgi:hypothetical protein
MRPLVEPDGEFDFNLLIEHRPAMFARMISEIPPQIIEMMLRSTLRRDQQVARSAAVMETFHRLCQTKNFSHDWFSSRAWAWHEPLAPLVDQGAAVLEVGAFEGRSTLFFLEVMRNSHVTVIDNFSLKKGWTSTQGITLQMDSEEAFHRNVAGYGSRVRALAMSSWAGLARLLDERAQFDVIFIDASHTMPDVMTDTLIAWRLLKPGGLFVWDDFLLDIWDWDKGPVGPGIAAFLRTFPQVWEVVHVGWQVFVRKRAELTEFTSTTAA